MSNAKRFLSVILAVIMICSTLVIGANAAYVQYKNAAIAGQYNGLDQAVLTTEQYASAAMDEVDRMLDEEQLQFTRADIVVGDVDLTSIDATFDSVYTLVNGTLFQTLSGMLGDLAALNVRALAPESAGGVRRGTSGKTDVDIIYALLKFLYDNRGLVASYARGTINIGSIVPSLVDISDYMDLNALLKGLLYEATYDEDAPADKSTLSIDTMAQDIIDRYIVDEFRIDGEYIGEAFRGHTNISTGTMYQFIDTALKICYNTLLVPLLNGNVKYELSKVCGVVYTKDDNGEIIDVDTSNLNKYADLLNIDYTVPTFNFTSATFFSQFNNILASIVNVMVNQEIFTWATGANSMVKTNVTNMAKAALVNTGDDFFASYIEVADAAEINAMTSEELTAYALRAIINGSVDGMYIPESATTIREFGYYTLKELLATSVPNCNFSSLDPDDTDSLIVMGINYAIYSVDAALDMGLEYVYDMEGVDTQINRAMQYAIDNYGGLLSGINFNSTSGWTNLNTLLFSLIPANWLPECANADVKTFLIDCLIENILDLNFEGLLNMLYFRSDSELQQTPKKVVINRAVAIVNTIFPGAMVAGNTLDALVTNSALGNTIDAVFSDLWNYRSGLVSCILPLVCSILDLTNEQEFEFPKLTFDETVLAPSGSLDLRIKLRNNSTGINTGYTDASGNFHQDSLYTYQILGVTTTATLSGMNITYPSTLAGGETGTVQVTGGFSNDNVLDLTISYKVLTEDGTSLTGNDPIVENIYCYFTKSSDSRDVKLTSTTTGNFTIKDGPLNVFAKSMSDLRNITLTVENGNTAAKTLSAYSNAFTVPETATAKRLVDADGNAWLELNPDTVDIIAAASSDVKGIAKIKLFDTTDAYGALESEEKDAVWDSMIERHTIKMGTTVRSLPKQKYDFGVQNGTTIIKNANAYICLYKDYGLGSILSSEMGKHRQPSAYSDATAWAAYVAAMKLAATAVYSPFLIGSFATPGSGKAAKYEAAATALKDAIENLDACASGASVDDLQALVDSFRPSNEDKVYTDSDYTFFSVSDFVHYTYYNYRDEERAANKLISKATTPDAETGEYPTISALDLAYKMHRVELYGSRLLPVTANKQHLAAELTNPTRNVGTADDWSAESWDNYQTALAFATSVNNTAVAGLRQSKVDTAYSELLEAEKRLVVDSAESSDASFDLVDPTNTGELSVIDTDDGFVLTGIDVFSGYEPEEFFECTGCSVQVTLNDNDAFTTGAQVDIVDNATGDVLATYLIAVYGDVTGDAQVDSADLSKISSCCGQSITFDAVETVAGDLTCDEQVDAADLSKMTSIAGQSVIIDPVNRTAA